jgi:hypothetical protein
LRSAALALIALVACTKGPSGSKAGPDALAVDTGSSPHEMVLVGPKHVTDLGPHPFNRMAGCGFEIEWGDPVPTPPKPSIGVDCDSFLRHTYAKPGSYTVRVRTYRILPTDGRETDWSDEVTVLVK